MRKDVKKLIFIGLEESKKEFFAHAQIWGAIHFIDPKKRCFQKEASQDIQKLLQAIKILRPYEVKGNGEFTDPSFVSSILEIQENIERLRLEEERLGAEIAVMAPLGDYSKEQIAWIEEQGVCKMRFYTAKQGAVSEELERDLLYLTTENNLDYFLAVGINNQTHPKLVEIHLGDSIAVLKENQAAVRQQIFELRKQLKERGKYLGALERVLAETVDNEQLSKAENYSEGALEQQVFVVEGWVPASQVATIREKSEQLHIVIEEVAIEPQDTVPTFLENQGLSKLGEDLVHVYDTPSIHDKDPSLWVLIFFALFFSMIIGDAGYGLILLLTTLYMGFRSKQAKNRRFFSLSVILSLSCIAWGVLATSFFGIKVAPDSPLRKVSLLTWLAEKKAHYHFSQKDAVAQEWVAKFPLLEEMESPQIFMHAIAKDAKTGAVSYQLFDEFSNHVLLELALFLGCVHMSLSLLRNLRRTWGIGLGWIILIFGCYLYFPQFLDATSMAHYVFGVDKLLGVKYGFWMICGGMALSISIALVKDRLFGLLEAMNVIQIFADAMSYLRLYALGLSGALVVSAMNELASGLNVFLAAFVLIAGHAINLVLCIMGGVIHGLRLNFLEWYHYSFEGGGKRFEPLKKCDDLNLY